MLLGGIAVMTIMDLYVKLAIEWKNQNAKRAELLRKITGNQNIEVAYAIYDSTQGKTTICAVGAKRYEWQVIGRENVKAYSPDSLFPVKSLSAKSVNRILNCKSNGPIFQGCTKVRGRFVCISSRPDMLVFSVEGFESTVLGIDYRYGEVFELESVFAVEKYPLNVSYVPMLAEILESSFEEDENTK